MTPSFDVDFEGFSGPLDLLCLLVETREIEASSVPLGDVVHRYAAFLVRSREVSLARAAEFLSLAARLLLGKVQALFPRPKEEILDERDDGADEEALRALLERYRPYRKAASFLFRLQAQRQRSFLRPPEEGPPLYDLGDLWGLSLLWWRTLEIFQRRQAQDGSESSRHDEGHDEGIPEAIPEEVQVERRMEEILFSLSTEETGLPLARILRHERGRINLIVTLLALLELSRLGRVSLAQKEVLGDVQVCRVLS